MSWKRLLHNNLAPGGAGTAYPRLEMPKPHRFEVNGERVQWGPAPCDPRWTEADPIDLTAVLREGLDVLGATMLFYGHGDGTWPIGKPALSAGYYEYVLDRGHAEPRIDHPRCPCKPCIHAKDPDSVSGSSDGGVAPTLPTGRPAGERAGPPGGRPGPRATVRIAATRFGKARGLPHR